MAHANAGVLLVEDDATTLRLEQFILEREGFAVTAVGSGEAALEALPATGPSVVLLDVGLPGMDGFATCRRMRQISRIPIIMVSARDTNEDKVRGLEIGADDYITKPFAPEEVVARVKAAVRRSNLDRGLSPAPRSRADAGQLTRRGKALKSFWIQQAAPRTRSAWKQSVFRLKAVRTLPVPRSLATRLRYLWSSEGAGAWRAGMKHLANRSYVGGLLCVRNLVALARRLGPVLGRLRRAMPRLAPADLGGKIRRVWGRTRTAPGRRWLERLVNQLPLPSTPPPGATEEEAPGSRLTESSRERDRTGGIGQAPGAEPIRAGDGLPGVPWETFGFPPATFLPLLFEGYSQVVTRKGGDPLSLAPVTPLVEIHALLSQSLEGAGEYSREAFTRDVYRLHRSGVQVTGSGARVSFPISRGVAGKTLALTDEAGEEKRYYGVRFIQEEGGAGPPPGSTSDPSVESDPGPSDERANPPAPAPSGAAEAEESDAASDRGWSPSPVEIASPGSASSREADGAGAVEAELHGFYIIKSLLHDVVDVNRVDIRHRKGYSVVILDENIKKPICRLRFGGRQKYLGLIDREKQERKVPVGDIDELYQYSDQLKAAVGYYEEP